jgi:hypothetical protein
VSANQLAESIAILAGYDSRNELKILALRQRSSPLKTLCP